MSEITVDNEMLDLARRAVACEGWRWMPGMRVLHYWTGGIRICVRDDGWLSEEYVVVPNEEGNVVVDLREVGIMGGFPDAQSAHPFLPDLTDPATLGCLLHLARDAWRDPGVHVWRSRQTGQWVWVADGQSCTVHTKRKVDGYPTEAGALVDALSYSSLEAERDKLQQLESRLKMEPDGEVCP